MKPGERVGVLIRVSSEEKIAIHMGFGIYEGYHVPEKNQGLDLFHDNNIRNPRIKLDTGEIVWGCQVWWGSEEKVKDNMKMWEEENFTVEQWNVDQLINRT